MSRIYGPTKPCAGAPYGMWWGRPVTHAEHLEIRGLVARNVPVPEGELRFGMMKRQMPDDNGSRNEWDSPVRHHRERTLLDRKSGEPAELQEGWTVTIGNLPARFRKVWGLPKKPVQATVRNVRGRITFVIRTEGEYAWDARIARIPLRELSRKAVINARQSG